MSKREDTTCRWGNCMRGMNSVATLSCSSLQKGKLENIGRCRMSGDLSGLSLGGKCYVLSWSAFVLLTTDVGW